jgi:hydroxyacylglutathione hydrolase
MRFFKVQVGPVGVWIIPALEDNYAYVVEQQGRALAVDPSDARAVRTLLAERGLTLERVLVTHHHNDHIFGLDELRALSNVTASGPKDARLPAMDEVLQEGSEVPWGELCINVLATPGHTASHVIFHEPGAGILFTGDTLFVAGCGRLLEGSPEDIYTSLQKIKSLPDTTRVFCGHDYAVENLRFAASVEPGRADLAAEVDRMKRRVATGMPSVPSTLAWEKQFNIFLRAATARELGALRKKKDKFA